MDFRSDLNALILGILQHGDFHGYEISRRINENGKSYVQVKESQLYPILHRLEAEENITAEWIPQPGKPARKVYRLTERGRGTLETKRADWSAFSASVESLIQSPREATNG